MSSNRSFSSERLILISLAVLVSTGAGDVSAQIASPSSWRDVSAATRKKLQAIYEARAFRAKSWNAGWLPDSSGYVVRERNGQAAVSVRYDVDTGERSETQNSGVVDGDDRRSPDGELLIGHRDRTLSLLHAVSGEQTVIAEHSAAEDIRYHDMNWSPDGERVLFAESDSTNVRERNMLVPGDPSYPGVATRKFARIGGEIPKIRLGVAAIDGSGTTWLAIPSPDEGFYLGQVEWAGNSDEILVEWLNRSRNERRFLIVSISTGSVRTLFQESSEAWVVASQQRNHGLIWIRDGKECVIVSEKDGWRHAYLYSRGGEELAKLTPGEYDIIERAVVDEAGGGFYFYASPENATERYLYRVPLDGSGTLERITPEDQSGWHAYKFSPDAKWAFHTQSTINAPPVTTLVQLPSHKPIRTLEDNSELNDRLDGVIETPTEFLTLEIGDGVSVDASMIRPPGFDPSNKYPVLVYVYGEPHLQTVLNQWGAGQNHFHHVIAGLGYIVVSIDNRGTPAPKGAAWRRAVFGSLGPLSTKEQAAALKELGRVAPYVDLSRTAIWGWSGGGSNTLNAMFREPDLYKVGIAVVPKPQPHLYNAWFQEIYMQTPAANPDGYKTSAPINYAEGLKGDLLIVTGSGETNTHIQIIEGLVDKLVALGKDFDYFVYPNRDHGLSEGPGSLVHVRALIARYLFEHLPAGPQ